MLVKCTLVVVYFAALFVVTRFLEFLGVLHRGMRCSEQPDDTRPLYTEQLRKVLDHRGISYRYVIERPELMALLNSSGNLYVVLASMKFTGSSKRMGSLSDTTLHYMVYQTF